MHCRIRLKDQLDPSWQEWLGNLKVVHDTEATSLLVGHLPDQAALYGVLLAIRRLGLNLLSVEIGEAAAHEEPQEPNS